MRPYTTQSSSYSNNDPIAKLEKSTFAKKVDRLLKKLESEPNNDLRAQTTNELKSTLKTIQASPEPAKTTMKDYIRSMLRRTHGPANDFLKDLWAEYERTSRALREGYYMPNLNQLWGPTGIRFESVPPSFQGQDYAASSVPSSGGSQYSGVMFRARRHGNLPQSAPMPSNINPAIDIVVNERARGGIGSNSASQLGYYPAPGPSASHSQVQSTYGQFQPAETSQQQFQGPIPVQDPATGQWWTYDPNGNRVFAPSAQGPWTRYD
ncbi:hypothetical protein DFH09DRAFT_1291274 [Mycena vulgaris]|nr:hypothetical protein DFH09DRAFT_1291274 [Mycena vulgaris]